MDIKDFAELAKDPEARVEIIKLIQETKEELIPIILVLKETLGVEADEFLNEVLRWSARKSGILFEEYIRMGFSRAEALSLVCNTRQNIADSIRHAK